ncbi:YceI family protein [Flavobacterium filum]|uniref:YceI family protein n=1 Tax=Flavobacterium filum TaxID=370974 RepID=UPI0004262774|nr:YceI family protein [Flavobacterium filum]
MKKNLTLLLLVITVSAFAQDKMITKTGKITFEASVPSFEEVKATNESVSCVLNTKTGEIAALALQKFFRFRIALMEEHYNENYVESDKFPKATFKGIIEKFSATNLDKNGKDYTIKGTLELHGKTKEIQITAKISKTDKGIEIKSDFAVNADDFAIEIPSIVSKKVSKKVNIKLDFTVK